MASPVRSITQAFAIVRLLAESTPLTLSEVARALALSPSSCLNLLRALVDEGAIERERQTKRYHLAQAWASSDLFRESRTEIVIDRLRPLMTDFTDEFGATAGLWKIIPGRRVRLIAHVQSNAPMRIQLADGQRQPLGIGAVGRALAAFQKVDDGELARRFAEVRWQRPMTLRRYIDEVRQTELQGYGVDDGWAFAGVCTVAVALAGSFAGFSVSASAFSNSLTPREIEKAGQSLAGSSQRLARRS